MIKKKQKPKRKASTDPALFPRTSSEDSLPGTREFVSVRFAGRLNYCNPGIAPDTECPVCGMPDWGTACCLETTAEVEAWQRSQRIAQTRAENARLDEELQAQFGGVVGDNGKELIGKSFGNLTAIDQATRSGKPHLVCRCKCGKATIASVANLVAGHTTSCGCSRRKKHNGYMHAAVSAPTQEYSRGEGRGNT